jgi:monofunctional glycosyltransferase
MAPRRQRNKPARPARPARLARLLRWARWLLAGWVIATAGVVLVLRFVRPPTTAFIVARRLQASRNSEPGFSVKQTWVPISRISPSAQLAFIAGEDQKFALHWGFDVQAIEDAMEDHLEGRSARGASTLTQQVAKNLFLWPGHSWVRKGLEAYFTVLIELFWPKRRILEVHLNVAELGNGLYGVEAASRYYFGKPAATLSPQEAAALAAGLPNPKVRRVNAPSARVLERMEWIADQAQRLPLDTLQRL